MNNFTDYRQHVGAQPDKFYKATLFESRRLMLGLNCLESGQTQHSHEHADQDKFYFVIEGQGEFVVGDERRDVGAGGVVWVPAGVPHGVTNTGNTRLVVLMGIAPWK
ncbi:MAG: cupin domain-containing protein [Anaerolineales bacterium]